MIAALMLAVATVSMSGMSSTKRPYFDSGVHYTTPIDCVDSGGRETSSAPTQDAPVVVQHKDVRVLKMMRWGLIPSWAKEESVGNRMINARAETIAEKPSFRNSFKRRRCLVLADGFYEWRKLTGGGKKIPMRIVLRSKEPFAFAGLWDIWVNPEGEEIESFTIITTEANQLLQDIHNRMPVILREEQEETWLSPEVDAQELLSILKPFPGEMEAYSVSTLVNSPSNDDPRCISSAEDSR